MMARSWLVQRVSKPHPMPASSPLAALGDNPFAFGGGLSNGGLSAEAMTLLRPIISFEYMGSAEFEFGAVPEALSSMVEVHPSLVARQRQIPLAEVAKDWTDRSTTPPPGEATIYILCHADHLDEVEKRIQGWAAESKDPDLRTKERVGLSTVLRPGRYVPDTCGWLELDNGFMFFTDREMWTAMCALLGLGGAADKAAS